MNSRCITFSQISLVSQATQKAETIFYKNWKENFLIIDETGEEGKKRQITSVANI